MSWARIKKWFDFYWEAAKKNRIDKGALERSRMIWKPHREYRPFHRTRETLLAQFDSDPDWFGDRPIRIAGYDYDDSISSQAKRVVEAEKSKRYSQEELDKYNRSRVLPSMKTTPCGHWNLVST